MARVLVAIVAALSLSTALALASEEEIHNWRSATVAAETSLFGRVEVTATASAGGGLEALAVAAKGKKIVVPPAWIKTLPDLPIASLQIRSEVGYDKDPWLYVYFRSSSKPEVHVHITFQSGKLAHATVKTVDAAGKVKVETRKAP